MALNQTIVESHNRVPLHRDQFTDTAERAWGHCEAFIDLTPLQDTQSTGLFISESWFADDCMFSQRAVDGNSHCHDEKHIRATGDILFVYRYLTGHVLGMTNDEPYAIYPGMIAIRDYGRPFRGIQMPGVAQGIFFPHHVLSFDPGQHPASYVFPETAAFAKVMNAELDFAFSEFEAGARHLPADRLARLKNCIRLVLQGKSANADIRAHARDALKDVICAFIEDNLTTLNLSPRTLLRRFGVSRASLFRMFAAEGGVRHYINDRRLYRAVHQLSHDPNTRGKISQVSEHWGFSSLANFNRSVRRQFGVKPSALFEAPLRSVPMPKDQTSISRLQVQQLMRRGRERYAASQFY